MAELSMFTGERVYATAVVRRAGSVLVVPAATVASLIGTEPEIGDAIMSTLLPVGAGSSSTTVELARAVGLVTSTVPTLVYDLVVVGAGPAGLASSVYVPAPAGCSRPPPCSC